MPHADPERKREYHRAYHEANRERLLAQRKAFRDANRQALNERRRAYRQANLERALELASAYRARNSEKRVAQARAWAQANPERRRVIAKEYAARRRSLMAGGVVEVVDRAYIYARDKGRCQIGYPDICLGRVPEDGGWHLDHIIPITPLRPGDPVGDHSHANTQVACPPCNSRKCNRATTTQLRLVG